MTMAWGAGINNVQGLNLPLWEASGTKRQRHRGVRAVEKEREGSRVWGEGKAGYSGAGILFPFLESPELALNSKGSLLCFWCRQINVNLLLLILGLLGTPSFPLFLRARCLVGCWRCFGVKLETKNQNKVLRYHPLRITIIIFKSSYYQVHLLAFWRSESWDQTEGEKSTKFIQKVFVAKEIVEDKRGKTCPRWICILGFR